MNDNNAPPFGLRRLTRKEHEELRQKYLELENEYSELKASLPAKDWEEVERFIHNLFIKI